MEKNELPTSSAIPSKQRICHCKEYVTVRQIKSLYSCWSKMLHEGKLTHPVNNIDEVEDIAEDSIDNDQVEFEQQKTILEVLEDVMNDQIYAGDDFVPIVYRN